MEVDMTKTIPWTDEQMAEVNGYRCTYIPPWNEKALVYTPGGIMLPVKELRRMGYTVFPPTKDRE